MGDYAFPASPWPARRSRSRRRPRATGGKDSAGRVHRRRVGARTVCQLLRPARGVHRLGALGGPPAQRRVRPFRPRQRPNRRRRVLLAEHRQAPRHPSRAHDDDRQRARPDSSRARLSRRRHQLPRRLGHAVRAAHLGVQALGRTGDAPGRRGREPQRALRAVQRGGEEGPVAPRRGPRVVQATRGRRPGGGGVLGAVPPGQPRRVRGSLSRARRAFRRDQRRVEVRQADARHHPPARGDSAWRSSTRAR